jgi:hypothetical protein
VKLRPPTRLEPIEESAVRYDDEGRPFTTAPRGDYTDASIARLEKEGRVHRTASGRVYIKYFLVKGDDGVHRRERRVDTLWTDVPPLRHAAPGERTGFPTQKPRALLDRIIACATEPGGLVVDLYSGSGTTAEAAHALGRRFVAGDAGAPAIGTSRARLLRAGARFELYRAGGATFPEAPAPSVHVSRSRGDVDVELRAPAEPAAWAIDDAYDPAGAFNVSWHAERTPGNKPVPATREARVAARGALGVRVWADDGAIATMPIEGAP